jgi:hypothetical protein
MKCGKPVPILQRVLQAKTEAKPVPVKDEPKPSPKETTSPDFQLYPDPDMATMETAGEGEEGGGWLASYADMTTISIWNSCSRWPSSTRRSVNTPTPFSTTKKPSSWHRPIRICSETRRERSR